MTKLFIGIDPGSFFCGYAFVLYFSDESLELLESGTITLQKTLTLAEKLSAIYSFLYSKIENYSKKYSDITLVIEKQFAGKNISSLITLSTVKGVLLLIGGQLKLKIKEYEPCKAKSLIMHGSSTKYEILERIKLFFPHFEPKYLDESDAVSLALIEILFN